MKLYAIYGEPEGKTEHILRFVGTQREAIQWTSRLSKQLVSPDINAYNNVYYEPVYVPIAKEPLVVWLNDFCLEG